jgi:hypothetical protein
MVAVTASPAAADPPANAIVFSGAPGTSAPPAILGPYAMTPFALDTQPVDSDVSSVAGPTGSVGFSQDVEHCLITGLGGGCWETWSNGYITAGGE